MAMFTGPTEWDIEPPIDPIAKAKSEQIDQWLQTERAKELSEGCRTLILSPDGDTFDAFRERVFDYLGEEVELSDSCTAKVASQAIQRKEKKRLGGLEPSILVYAIDPGQESDSTKLLEKLRKAMAHFLFTTRSLGLGAGCAVVVMLARMRQISTCARGSDRNSWVNLFPTLQAGKDIRAAVETEFEAAGKAQASPLQIKFAFDDETFDDLSIVRKLMKDAHGAIIGSLGETAPTIKIDEFFDAPQPQVEEKAAPVSIQWFSKLSRERKEMILSMISRVIFALEFVILVFAVVFAIPWGTVFTFLIFILESIGLRF